MRIFNHTYPYPTTFGEPERQLEAFDCVSKEDQSWPNDPPSNSYTGRNVVALVEVRKGLGLDALPKIRKSRVMK